MSKSSGPLLSVRDLAVRFATPGGEVFAVRKLSYAVAAGETIGIVGESGSGKSQSVLALMGLLPENGHASGTAHFEGEDLISMPRQELAALRGAGISMVFQDPMTALNPYLSIGRQMRLVLQRHLALSAAEAHDRCVQALAQVRIPEPVRRLKSFPHELSGGQRQRVMLATALLCKPRLLIADEPTTALDVTVQAQMLALMRELQEETGTAIILITHDLGVVAGQCDHVVVLEAGEVRERSAVDELFSRPQHAYTQRLLRAVPRIDAAGPPQPSAEEPLLTVDSLSVEYEVLPQTLFGRRRQLRAVTDVSLELSAGETLGVVGESGCGKSTLARAVLRLIEVAGGRVSFLGSDLLALEGASLRDARRELQVVFQDPLAALNPRMSIGDIVGEPLRNFSPDLSASQREARVAEMLTAVGLSPADARRYPHEFSGGQCQRVGIARALISRPRVVVCDEAVSALDVSIQAQIIELLEKLQREMQLALVFIAHDLAVVRQISHRVLVMYLGRAVELAPGDQLYSRPQHPYTRALLSAVPVPDPASERTRQSITLSGEVPSPLKPPAGCAFHTRCAHAQPRCQQEVPELRRVESADVACHFAGTIDAENTSISVAG